MSTPTPIPDVTDDQLISKYVEYLNVFSKFPRSRDTINLRNYILSVYNSKKTYYTRSKTLDIHKKSFEIYKNLEIKNNKMMVLKRLYYGYLKFDYISKMQNNLRVQQMFREYSNNSLKQYNTFKTINMIDKASEAIVKNESIIDLLVLIQRDINILMKNNTVDTTRLNKENKVTKKQQILNKINKDSDLLNNISILLNTKLGENPSISKSDIDKKAKDASYILREYYEEEKNLQCVGIC